MQKLLTLACTIILPVFATAGSLGDYIESPIEKDQVISLGQETLSFRPCSDCAPMSLTLKDDTRYYELTTSVSKTRAHELMIADDYKMISVFYSRSNNTVDRVQFGVLPEVSGDHVLSGQEILP